ncbi:MAG: WxL protein peptidoglycan domain-containing protein [Patescibacteria group bacterium]|jgi:hypothetical protein
MKLLSSSSHKLPLALISFLLTAILVSSPAQAQNSSALTVIPPKFELFGNPGDTISEKIRVRNESDEPMTYSILVEDFTTSGEEGHVVLEEGESDASYSLAKWIEPSTRDIILQPKEEQAFNFMINIPRNGEPGGHYASILFQTGADTDVPGGAKVAQRVGTLVLLRVSGNVVEKAILEDFSAPKYLEKGPVKLLARVKNESNTHIIPQGTIVITNIFGKKVAEIPLEGRNVLPGAIRKMETTWDQANVMGVFTATLIATYGQNKLPLTAATKFTVIPKMVLILGFVAAVAIVGFVLTLVVGRKRLAKVLKVMFKG